MKERILKALDFCNLLDLQGKISLTNLGLVLLLGRIALAPALDWASVTTLALAFANYMHKRNEGTKAEMAAESEEMAKVKSQYEAAVAAQAKALVDLNAKLSSVADAVKVVDLSKLRLR